MSVLRRALTPVERRDFPSSDPFSIPAPGSLAQQLSSAGTEVSESTALSLMTFYAGVRIITDSITYLPLRAVTMTPTGLRQPVKKAPSQIVDPFAAIAIQEGISQIITSLILRGNAYLVEVAWDSAMNPIQWRILHPDQVRVEWDQDGYRKYQINGRWWDASTVVHLTNFMLPGALKGAGIIEYCRNSLGLGVALDEVAGSFFKNGTMATGVISVDSPLTPDEAKSAALQFQQNHSGTKRAHLPIIMGGGAKFQQMSLSPDDAQFIQSRIFEQGQIATLLGIPPHLLGLVDRTTSWGTGIEVQVRGFLDFTLRPYIQRLQTMFTSWLPKGMYAEFTTDALSRADTATRYANYQSALLTGWRNKDEIRAEEGYAPLPDGAGQIYYIPANEIPVGKGQGSPLPAANPNTGDPNAGD